MACGHASATSVLTDITFWYLSILVFLCLDAVYAAVQPARQVAAAEVVCCTPRQDKEEDCSRASDPCLVPQTKDV